MNRTIPLPSQRPPASLAAAAVLALTLAGLGGAAAHIVPPEDLHPAVESYRRLAFFLDLEPVPWDAAREDAGTLADAVEEVMAEERGRFRADLAELLASGAAAEDAATRRAAAAAVFETATRRMAELVIVRLELARAALDRHAEAAAHFDEARRLWLAFEHEIRATDPWAHGELGTRWLELSSSLGSPGVLGIGAVAADLEVFAEEAGEITRYLRRSFGESYTAPSGRLAPLPVGSPTFDPMAPVPVRLPPGSDINKQLPRPRQILNMAERGVDERLTPLVALGDMAFDSALPFGEPARSLGITCNTCHNKSITNPNFFIPGLSARPGGMDVSNAFFASHANNAHFDPIDIPDLRGIRFTAPYGRNGRFDSLREFTRNVIVNEFNGPEPQPILLDGLVAYMLEFDFLPNPLLERDGSLSPEAPEAARRGEELFHRPFEAMGGRSCASCHIPSDHFLDRRRHDIGSVAGTGEHSRDGALDTPTLLGIRYTPPYFHDGSLPSLAAVVDWFDESYSLGLEAAERADLTSYLEVVGDGVDAYEDTVHTLEAELEEFSFFLSTWELLLARGHADLAEMTARTVAFELRAHKWDVQDPSHLPLLEEMAVMMDRAAAAIAGGDPSTATDLVAEYRETYAANAEVLR